jgi:hypothetical protein
MVNRIALFLAALAIVFSQACSKNSHTEVTDSQYEGPLAGDPTTAVRSADGKFLCDFQWTKGLKELDYAAGDNVIKENNNAYDPWCLIPYGDSTGFAFTAKSDEGVESYICRDLKANYSLKNEHVLDINEIYDTHMQMMCVSIDNVFVTAVANLADAFKQEKLYHIRKTEGLYTIDGHLNLLLVRPVRLTVFWEPIFNLGMATEFLTSKLDGTKIEKDFERYMKKLGYYIDIVTVPIFFPNIIESVNDGALTLPKEMGIFSIYDNIIKGYNYTLSVINFIGEIFGVNPDLNKMKQADYIIATTPGYKVRYEMQMNKHSETIDPLGNVQRACEIDLKQSEKMYIVENIKNLPNSVSVDYYTNSNLFLGSGLIGTILNIPETACRSVAYATGENFAYKPQAFEINKGYVLSDAEFFKSKNTGRLLAALLYSKIREIEDPMKNSEDGLWLSSYFDDSDVEMPKKFWETRKGSSDWQQQNRQQLLQLAFTIHNFGRRAK